MTMQKLLELHLEKNCNRLCNFCALYRDMEWDLLMYCKYILFHPTDANPVHIITLVVVCAR